MVLTRLPVYEYTTPDPHTASEDTSIDAISELMQAHGIRHLPILREHAVVGLISERDVRLLSGLSSAERAQVRAGDIMATDPISVTIDTPLDEVAYLMSDKKVGSVIVLDAEQRLYGIFTATDALNALIEIARGGSDGMLG